MGTAAPQRTLGLEPRLRTLPSCFSRAVPGPSKNQPEQVSLEWYVVAKKKGVLDTSQSQTEIH